MDVGIAHVLSAATLSLKSLNVRIAKLLVLLNVQLAVALERSLKWVKFVLTAVSESIRLWLMDNGWTIAEALTAQMDLSIDD